MFQTKSYNVLDTSNSFESANQHFIFYVNIQLMFGHTHTDTQTHRRTHARTYLERSRLLSRALNIQWSLFIRKFVEN